MAGPTYSCDRIFGHGWLGRLAKWMSHVTRVTASHKTPTDVQRKNRHCHLNRFGRSKIRRTTGLGGWEISTCTLLAEEVTLSMARCATPPSIGLLTQRCEQLTHGTTMRVGTCSTVEVSFVPCVCELLSTRQCELIRFTDNAFHNPSSLVLFPCTSSRNVYVARE
jgi:hypothetical protein